MEIFKPQRGLFWLCDASEIRTLSQHQSNDSDKNSNDDPSEDELPQINKIPENLFNVLEAFETEIFSINIFKFI